MKLLLIPVVVLALTGCSALGSKDYSNYVESSKAISKDNTMSQTACYAAVAEIAKNGDNAAKVSAIALADKCKNPAVTVVPPKPSLFGW
jgi:hypothetical protein